MQTTYRNYQISVGTTERRDGSIVTEACIALDYQPLHSIFTYYGQEALALEQAQRWIDEREDQPALAAQLTTALAELETADQLADTLDADTSWSVGLELLAARAAVQRASDMLAQKPQSRIVRSPALDAIYASTEEWC